MKYSSSFLKENGFDESAIKLIEIYRKSKESLKEISLFEFQISDGNQDLKLFIAKEESKEHCPGSRLVLHYERVK